MERLTGFEFIAAGDGPQIVRMKKGDVVLAEYLFFAWIATPLPEALLFAERGELTIEGQGIGRPYWNDEATPWTFGFDPVAEAKRIAAIRAAAIREINRASLSLM